jgi:DNA-binding MarR family transcriptional regulator
MRATVAVSALCALFPWCFALPAIAASQASSDSKWLLRWFNGGNVTLLNHFGQPENVRRSHDLLKSVAAIEFVDLPDFAAGAVIKVRVTNKGAGHELPSGFPEGRERGAPLAAVAHGPRATAKGRRGRRQSLTALLAHAHYLLTESFLDPLGAEGLSATEARLLVALAEEDAVGPSELARAACFKLATVTKALDRIEQAKLVRRHRLCTRDDDRRRVLIHLTPRGRSVAEKLARRTNWQRGRVRRALGPGAERNLKAALRLLVTRLLDLAPERPSGAPRCTRGAIPTHSGAATGAIGLSQARVEGVDVDAAVTPRVQDGSAVAGPRAGSSARRPA